MYYLTILVAIGLHCGLWTKKGPVMIETDLENQLF